MMNAPRFRLGFKRKIGYSFLGLVAGNATCLLVLSVGAALAILPTAFANQSDSWHDRVLNVLGPAILFGLVSIVAWVVIGLPLVLSLSAKLTAQLHWSLASLIGAVLGAGALALLFVSLDGWQQTVTELRSSDVLRVDITFLAAAVLIAAVAFSFYCALVRRAVQREQRKSGAPRTPQFFSVF